MAVAVGRELKAVIAVIPEECYANPAWKGLGYFCRDVCVYAAGIVGLLYVDVWYLVIPLWIVATLGISALFVVGHDAAHGALFRRKPLCYAVGQLAFLPSLHAYEVWALGHNRLHHGHTGCQGIDFVWHPLTRPQYEALPWWARLRHRIEWTPWGAGLYYMRVVWWDKMVHAAPPQRLRTAFRRDRIVVGVFAALMTCGLLYFGHAASGAASGALWVWCKVFLVPWLLFNQTIGTVVYLHHIAPDVSWHSRASWNQRRGQLDGTVSYSIPPWLNFFWHNIFVHVPHHVDVRIPFYHLPRALEAIVSRLGAEKQTKTLRLADYFRHARRCKLYDFAREAWTDYRGRAAGSVS
jgi:omega-6 fatty acid desaturase (delta-12 desaturase)